MGEEEQTQGEPPKKERRRGPDLPAVHQHGVGEALRLVLQEGGGGDAGRPPSVLSILSGVRGGGGSTYPLFPDRLAGTHDPDRFPGGPRQGLRHHGPGEVGDVAGLWIASDQGDLTRDNCQQGKYSAGKIFGRMLKTARKNSGWKIR